jgi:hypothetical protein
MRSSRARSIRGHGSEFAYELTYSEFAAFARAAGPFHLPLARGRCMAGRSWLSLPAILVFCFASSDGIAAPQSGVEAVAVAGQAAPPSGDKAPEKSGKPGKSDKSADAGQDERSAEEELQPAEPDFTLINLQTTLRLPLHRAYFRLTHRFNRDLRHGSFGQIAGDLFGLDNGAVIGLEFRFAVARHLDAGFYRSSFDKTIQLTAKYDGWHQGGALPVSISGLVSIEGANNFQERYAPALGAVISRTLGSGVALYASPVWVNNTAALLDTSRNTFYLGVGTRLRILKTVYLVAEVAPRLGGFEPGEPSYGFAIEKLVGGHIFQLNFSNDTGTTFGQLARGGVPHSIYLGFNISRKFY